MFRGRKPLWLVAMAIFGVVLLGGIWTYALGGLAKITNVTLMDDEDTAGYIVTDLDGDTPINPKYNDGSGIYLKDMYEATEVYISPLEPLVVNGVPVPGQKVVSATFGAAWNVWVTWGGTKFWVAP